MTWYSRIGMRPRWFAASRAPSRFAMSPAEDDDLLPPADESTRGAASAAPSRGCDEARVVLVARASLPAPPQAATAASARIMEGCIVRYVIASGNLQLSISRIQLHGDVNA